MTVVLRSHVTCHFHFHFRLNVFTACGSSAIFCLLFVPPFIFSWLHPQFLRSRPSAIRTACLRSTFITCQIVMYAMLSVVYWRLFFEKSLFHASCIARLHILQFRTPPFLHCPRAHPSLYFPLATLVSNRPTCRLCRTLTRPQKIHRPPTSIRKAPALLHNHRHTLHPLHPRSHTPK